MCYLSDVCCCSFFPLVVCFLFFLFSFFSRGGGGDSYLKQNYKRVCFSCFLLSCELPSNKKETALHVLPHFRDPKVRHILQGALVAGPAGHHLADRVEALQLRAPDLTPAAGERWLGGREPPNNHQKSTPFCAWFTGRRESPQKQKRKLQVWATSTQLSSCTWKQNQGGASMLHSPSCLSNLLLFREGEHDTCTLHNVGGKRWRSNHAFETTSTYQNLQVCIFPAVC